MFDFQGGIYRYDLTPKAPIITREEARKIDCCLKSQAYEEQEEYTVNMSDCGRRVVARSRPKCHCLLCVSMLVSALEYKSHSGGTADAEV